MRRSSREPRDVEAVPVLPCRPSLGASQMNPDKIDAVVLAVFVTLLLVIVVLGSLL